ncbi:unnamed protein product [Staurois parvus]|uniref:G-protein coupled receptors family 1 profile domain-containing protein n=1 Tax=Staurois parvus TaxID=386267 RepID=A0ABN9EVZ3_9NEOB|nr:unnamed protein product [Staurois parvus]
MITTLVLLFVFLVGVPGNALVLWVTGVKMKRRVSTVWFCNLALADIICCSLAPLVIINLFASEWPYGSALCKILPFIIILNMFSSVFILVAISIDRCILVVWPVWAQNHRRLRTTWNVCLVVWIVSVALGLPSAIYRKTETVNNVTECVYIEEYRVPITLTRMVFGFLIPLLIILCCYIRLVCKAQNIQFSKAARKTARVSLAIIMAFFITWTPFHVFGTLLLYTQDKVVVALYDPAQSMAYFNSCINPILYAFMGKDVKSKVRRPIRDLIENAFNQS